MVAKIKTHYKLALAFTATAGGMIVAAIMLLPTADPGIAVKQPDTASSELRHKATIASPQVATVAAKKPEKQNPHRPPHATSRVSTATTNPSFLASTGRKYPLRTYHTTAVNDPYGPQWWTTSTNLDDAWAIGAGSTPTTVAVIDTGFGLQHEELASRWAVNTAEQGATISEGPSVLNCSDGGSSLSQSCNLIDDDYDGIVDNEVGVTTLENPSRLNCSDRELPLNKSCNLIDDDSNGYADDVRGWDFANYDASVQAGEVSPGGEGTRHGTEVSGVLAATGNNGKGIAGVNWSTKVLPIQAIGDDDYGNTLTVGRSIYYAISRDVDVISLSLGAAYEDDYTREAVQTALDNGILVVAASGNDGCDCMLYPANYPEVLAVGANNSSQQRSSFSSYGSNLDIVAPGEDMITSTWSQASPTSLYAGGVAGTSFATPYVSGLLSLARSHQPNATWGELVANLQATANHSSLSATSPTSSQIGFGYARADAYMSRVTSPSEPGTRYQFSTSSQSGTLGSSRVYDCTPEAAFPSLRLFAVTAGSQRYYTVDILEKERALALGTAVSSLGFACAGLPHDQPLLLRPIDLSGEINNQPGAKYQY